LALQIKPLSTQVENTLSSVDSVLFSLHSVFDESTKENLRSSISNLNTTLSQFAQTSVKLNDVVKNLGDIASNFQKNNGHITNIMVNADKASTALAQAPIQSTITELHQSVQQLHLLLSKINSDNGTLGLLINDKGLYHNLQNSSLSLNHLLEDLKLNPKRYVHFSLFGGKEKTRPLPPDSLIQN
ncbi:MAG: hypothetical protein ACYCOO_08585, partial [Chitinophagaceae bacterium]